MRSRSSLLFISPHDVTTLRWSVRHPAHPEVLPEALAVSLDAHAGFMSAPSGKVKVKRNGHTHARFRVESPALAPARETEVVIFLGSS